MEAGTRLVYQSIVSVGGQQLHCVESYDSIFERMRMAHFKGDAAKDELQWMEPLELTTKGDTDGTPMRVAVAPHAITFVGDLLEADRTEVPE